MSFTSANTILEETRQGEVWSFESAQDDTVRVPRSSGRKMYLESYGCQMNFSDSEIVASILLSNGFSHTKVLEEADLVLINTCAIRDNAEQRVRQRLQQFSTLKKNKPDMLIAVLGCMAERLKKKFLEEEKLVDIVAGPDSYRDLPNLVATAENGQKAMNVFLSREETYADVNPVRLDSNGITAFISIMRGCDNMCSFCVVPYTRGRERSRDVQSIVKEAKELYDMGYREVTLLGQNVDSYKWREAGSGKLEAGSGKMEDGGGKLEEKTVSFANLLEAVAHVAPDLRIRFSTSHPKDITEDVVRVMAKYDNICKYIHLPVQSGSSRILKLMNRTYDREWYMDRIDMIRSVIPDIGLSTDVITGFCSETEAEHEATLNLMEKVKFDYAYMFMYSERPGTPAAKTLKDDVAGEIKNRRLQEIIELQNKHSLESNRNEIGKIFEVLVEGPSKRSDEMLMGRTSRNKVVVFPKADLKRGDYVKVEIKDCTGATLLGN